MDNAKRLAIFQAQTKNVRSLEKAATHLRRSINRSLRLNERASSVVHTKTLALVYCAWAEATFSKLIHTPYGFALAEISDIKKVVRGGSITQGWYKAVDVGISKASFPTSNEAIEARRHLRKIIDLYIKEPSEIRNKIAHGQWVVALNGKGTNIEPNATTKLEELSIVDVDRWFSCSERMALMIEHLIESPHKAFINTYKIKTKELDEHIQTVSKYNIEDKIARLMMKPIVRNDKTTVSQRGATQAGS